MATTRRGALPRRRSAPIHETRIRRRLVIHQAKRRNAARTTRWTVTSRRALVSPGSRRNGHTMPATTIAPTPNVKKATPVLSTRQPRATAGARAGREAAPEEAGAVATSDVDAMRG